MKDNDRIKIYEKGIDTPENKKGVLTKQVEGSGLFFNAPMPLLPKKGFLINKNAIFSLFLEFLAKNRNSKANTVSLERVVNVKLPTIKTEIDAEKPLIWDYDGETEAEIKIYTDNESFKCINRDTIAFLVWLMNSLYYNFKHNKGLNGKNKRPTLLPFSYYDYLKVMKTSPYLLPLKKYDNIKVSSLGRNLYILKDIHVTVKIPKIEKEFNFTLIDDFKVVDTKHLNETREDYKIILNEDFITMVFLLSKSFYNLTSTFLNCGRNELAKVLLAIDFESHELYKIGDKKINTPYLVNMIPTYVSYLMSDTKHLSPVKMRDILLKDLKYLYELDFFEFLEFVKDGEILTINQLKSSDLKGITINYKVNKLIETEREFNLNFKDTELEKSSDTENESFI